MTFYRRRRVFVACLATAIATLAAGLSGLAVDQFLAGVLGGGALTAVLLTMRNRSH